MATFTDNTGMEWSLNIKVSDIERVKSHVKGVGGKPVDLLEVAEKGDFSAISGSVQTILNVIFWLLLDDIMAHFDREAWDADHAALYEAVPEEKKKTNIQKAADWFGSRISGEQVLQMVKAWEEALLGFIPTPRVRQAIEKVMEREEIYRDKLFQAAEQKALEEIGQNEAQLGTSSTLSQGKSGSHRKRSPSVN